MGLFVTNKTYREAVNAMNNINKELNTTKSELLTYLQKNNNMFDFTMDIIKKYIPVEYQESYIQKINSTWTKEETKIQPVEPTKDDGTILCTFTFRVGTVFDNDIPNAIKELAETYEFKNIKLKRTKELPTVDEYILSCKGNYLAFEKFKKSVRIML